MVFVADDLAAWLTGLLADAGRRQLTAVVLGTDQQRALRSTATTAVRLTAAEFWLGNDEQAGHAAMVISEVFGEAMPSSPLAEYETVLESLRAGIAAQLEILDDASLTGTGQSAADALGISVTVLTKKLTANLLREILTRGSRGGPLFPLASQLNHDEAHLQGQQLDRKLDQLKLEIIQKLGRLEDTRESATPVALTRWSATMTGPKNVDSPPSLVNLPERPVLFVGRTKELDRLDKALALQGDVVVQAVHGLGGIGKSTLAARWASLNSAQYNPVWWISADTRAGIDSGLAALAQALNAASGRALPHEVLQEWAVQWLATHQGWLIILDNVNDPADVKALLARAAGGRFLITSRRATGWHGIATPLQLDLMTEAEAVELLTAFGVSRRFPKVADSAELCKKLGYLPLAIEQAGAYIAETGISIRDYMALMAKYPDDMYRASAEGCDASRTIARIWDVTLDRLSDEPLTGQLLRILAWYAPDDIPRSLVDGAGRQLDVLHALGRLAAYSMITIHGEFLAVHRLVQAVARSPDTDSPHLTANNLVDARLHAINLLQAALPDEDHQATWRDWEMLLPHVDALASYLSPELDTVAITNIINRSALFRAGIGSDNQVISSFRRALDHCQRVFGQDHQDTMTCWNNLAFAYQSAGELDLAIPLYEENLEDRVRILGPDHPDVLISRNNLAYAYQLAGDLTRALPLYEENLEDRIRILGPDHPQTLTSRNNLAHACKSVGDLARAIHLYKQNLEDRTSILGPDHPQTLISRNNLAHAYWLAGDPASATLFKRNADETNRILSHGDPITRSAKLSLMLVR